jgi:hypothetical protein
MARRSPGSFFRECRRRCPLLKIARSFHQPAWRLRERVGFQLRSQDGFETAIQYCFRRHSEQSGDVGANLADDEIRLGDRKQHSMRLDLANDVNRFLRTSVEAGSAIQVFRGGHERLSAAKGSFLSSLTHRCLLSARLAGIRAA